MTWRLRLFAVLVISLHASVSAPGETSASQRFQDFTSEMRRAHASGDWRAFRASALKLGQFLNGSPDALLEVARADARLGDQTGALEQLRAFVGAGQSNEILKTLTDFAHLRSNPDFKKILDRMASNLAPISHATLAFVIPEAGLLPEDIDYDTQSRRFFLTSVLEKKIVAIDASGRMTDFAQAPDKWPLLALKVDAQRRLLWATEVALDGFTSVSRSGLGAFSGPRLRPRSREAVAASRWAAT